MKSLKIVVGVFMLFVLSGVETWAQCAMCRGTVESSMGNGRNNVGVGLNTGIIYLFVMPYLLVAIVGYLWYRNSTKDLQRRQFIANRIKQAYHG